MCYETRDYPARNSGEESERGSVRGQMQGLRSCVIVNFGG